MNHITIPFSRLIKLNSFHPLCGTSLGVNAIIKYNLPPFIDASCRREPDLQNPFPSISALCRQGTFAPHLKKYDIVVYMTIGGAFSPYKKGHHLVAILQVEDVFESHELGAKAYLDVGLEIPSNCMVEGNPPFDFFMTAGQFTTKSQRERFLSRTEKERIGIGRNIIKSWNNEYLEKSKKWRCFIKTKPIYVNHSDPIQIMDSDFDTIFGKIPNTRTPNIITGKQLIELAMLADLNLILDNCH